jgi:hypothetical protein
VTARFALDPLLWNKAVSVSVGKVGGGIPVGTTAPLGGFGTGNGGDGAYIAFENYATGGGGGSSVAVGVRVFPPLLFVFLHDQE